MSGWISQQPFPDFTFPFLFRDFVQAGRISDQRANFIDAAKGPGPRRIVSWAQEIGWGTSPCSARKGSEGSSGEVFIPAVRPDAGRILSPQFFVRAVWDRMVRRLTSLSGTHA